MVVLGCNYLRLDNGVFNYRWEQVDIKALRCIQGPSVKQCLAETSKKLSSNRFLLSSHPRRDDPHLRIQHQHFVAIQGCHLLSSLYWGFALSTFYRVSVFHWQYTMASAHRWGLFAFSRQPTAKKPLQTWPNEVRQLWLLFKFLT